MSDVFETGVHLMDVSSSHRPDTSWRTVDAQGHEHRWYIARPGCRNCGHLLGGHVKNERVGGGDIWFICPEQRQADRMDLMTRYEPQEAVQAESYFPTQHHVTPTLVWVKDGEEYWEDDDEPHAIGHLECRQCGEHIEPGYTADMVKQQIPGLRWYRINGEPVSPEEYARRRAENA